MIEPYKPLWALVQRKRQQGKASDRSIDILYQRWADELESELRSWDTYYSELEGREANFVRVCVLGVPKP